ncbi:MAG: ATP-binding protein [Lachnospiraceae bacterium]|nr:ATP-binding protein [Lachnospiraceae bacterium]
MLIQYSVRNYKSIKDEIVINFTAMGKEVDSDKLINDEIGCSVYRCIGLVGPNASGKSNIISSLFFALRFINATIERKEKSKINIEMFMLDKNSREEGSSFEFIFYENNIKYVYGFTIDTERVLEEYLLAYYSKKATTIFERDVNIVSEYNFRGNDVKAQNEISKKTNSNRLYLPVAAEWGYEKAKDPYKWFEKMFRQYSDMNISQVIADVVKDASWKNVLLEALSKADFNIKDIYVKNKKIEKQQRDAMIQFLTNILGEGEVSEDIIPEDTPVIWVTHASKSGETFNIEMNDDSSGTRDIIDNLAEMLFVNKEGGLFIEDELGRNYHTKLTEYFLEQFNSNEVNYGRAQLFFSTHDTKILNLLNPEQIYLVDKDEDGATYVKLLDDYLIREKDNIELGYLKGRYGAVPNIKE